jgi:hypothetical protein
MAKIYTYIFIAIGFSALLGLLGVSSTMGNFMQVINPNTVQDWYETGFFASVAGAIAVLGSLGVVVVGIFGRQVVTTALTASLATAGLITVLGDWVRIVSLANNAGGVWQGWLVSIIMAPFIASFVFALWDWVRSGGDT